MRLIAPLADRLLSLVAPRVTAQAACCNPFGWKDYCYCSGGVVYQKTCESNCCSTFCGSCQATTTKC